MFTARKRAFLTWLGIGSVIDITGGAAVINQMLEGDPFKEDEENIRGDFDRALRRFRIELDHELRQAKRAAVMEIHREAVMEVHREIASHQHDPSTLADDDERMIGHDDT